MAFKYETRVLFPDIEYPDINFVGRLIGQKGRTIQQIQRDTDCQITISGKNSRDHRQTQLQQQTSGYALVKGYENDHVKRAVKIIKDIINDRIEDFEQSRSNVNHSGGYSSNRTDARKQEQDRRRGEQERRRRYQSTADCVDLDRNSPANGQVSTVRTLESQM